MLDQDSYFAYFVQIIQAAENDRRRLEEARQQMKQQHH